MASGADYLVARLTDDVIRKVVKAVTRLSEESERALLAAFEEKFSSDARFDLNTKAAEAARQETLTVYDREVTHNGHVSYTRRTRFGGGALRRAIESDEFIFVDSKSVAFGNEKLMNRKAKQWGRLNFGAGRVGEGSKVLSEPARPAFTIPEGFFLEGNRGARVGTGHARGRFDNGRRNQPYRANFQQGRKGQDSFFPQHKGPPLRTFPTIGIRARHFLDAGYITLAAELRRGYGEQIHKFNEQFQEGIVRAVRLAEE